MKKKFYTLITVAFMVLLLVSVGAINCVRAQDYSRISYYNLIDPTVDGEWTSEDEWTDGDVTVMSDDAVCRSTWIYSTSVFTHWLVEFFGDTTDDAEDYWEFCIDGDQDMGSAPQANDFKFVITGHSDLVWYQGTGTGWDVEEIDETEMPWADSLSASPTNDTPHWILEFVIDKNAGTVLMGIYWNLRVACYDASTETLAYWPPDSDADVPDTWGMEDYTSESIPEGISFSVLVLLSSVAVVVAAVVLRKRSRID